MQVFKNFKFWKTEYLGSALCRGSFTKDYYEREKKETTTVKGSFPHAVSLSMNENVFKYTFTVFFSHLKERSAKGAWDNFLKPKHCCNVVF